MMAFLNNADEPDYAIRPPDAEHRNRSAQANVRSFMSRTARPVAGAERSTGTIRRKFAPQRRR